MPADRKQRLWRRPDDFARRSKAGCSTIGLVLEGGGAKGAFQFGCLKALAENGIAFDVIAGTSVGSLNGALWSTRQLEWGQNFWETISFDRVYPLRHPAAFFVPIAATYAVMKLLSDRIRRSPFWGFLAGISLAWIGCFSLLALLVLLVSAVISLFSSEKLQHVDTSYLGFALVYFFPLVLIFVVELLGVSAFTSAPLRTNLNACLVNKPFDIPLFATTSHRHDVYDPDHLFYGSTGIPPSNAISLPQPSAIYIPKYTQLTQGNFDPLLASAALPYGIVPGIADAVDGGLADNLPVFPVVSLMSCEVVLIVRANSGHLSKSFLLRHWRRIDRTLRLEKYDAGSAHIANPRPTPIMGNQMPTPLRTDGRPAEPLRTPQDPPHVLVIGPVRRKLGPIREFLERTLNFRPEFTIPEMTAGYEHTIEELKSGRLQLLRGG